MQKQKMVKLWSHLIADVFQWKWQRVQISTIVSISNAQTNFIAIVIIGKVEGRKEEKERIM